VSVSRGVCCAVFAGVACLRAAPAVHAQVLTSQYDNAGTGATLTETTLTPANVDAARFGKVLSLRPYDATNVAREQFNREQRRA